jgi:type I restriction enzyme R subunit
MSNFAFLPPQWSDIRTDAMEAERHALTAPVTAAFYARLALERTVLWMYAHDGSLTPPYQPDLSSHLRQQCFQELVPLGIYNEIQQVKREGNSAAHGRKVQAPAATAAVKFLHRFLWWFAGSYSADPIAFVRFDESLLPKVGNGRKTLAQLQALQQDFESQQTELAAERKRREDSEAELEKLRQEMEAIRQLREHNRHRAEPPPPYTEEETRDIFVDVLLTEAGWDVPEKLKREVEVTGMPRETNPNGKGRADYVLYGANGLPVAVVEAKRTSRNAAEGRTQAKLYADCLEQMTGQRPAMYTTNGYAIEFWDDLFARPRKVMGFHTQDELELLVLRRTTRQDIRQAPIEPLIAGRPYQVEAVRRVMEAYCTSGAQGLVTHRRGALVVMATGAGKTRTAASMVDVLVRCNWARRVLFLADRNALVRQARRSFGKLLPNLSSVNLTEDRVEGDTRIVFSTYQTILNRIDASRLSDYRLFGAGYFDLVIVDEAHRSVYEKYGAIFQHFDALLLGLTATPRAEAHRDTYALFGCDEHNPTAWYELDQAVADGHLVPPKGQKVELGFMRHGVRYADLSETERKRYEDTFRDDMGNLPDEIDAAAINRWLFNKDTIRKVLNHLMTHGLRVEGGDRVGKSIVFARSHQHALAIQAVFEEEYPELTSHFLQLIDNYDPYALDTLARFSESDRLPQIAVSVDMLDTGIDIPEILNLVFFKPVYSSSKYWQMIGRGTRLCPDLFGPGQDKECFRVFDICGNFDFFDAHPDGIEGAQPRSLSHLLLEARILLAEALREPHLATDALIALRIDLLDQAHAMVAPLWELRHTVRVRAVLPLVDVFRHRAAWDNLSLSQQADLMQQLGPIIEPDGSEEKSRRFDLLVLRLMLELALRGGSVQRHRDRLMATVQGLLRLANIPSVQAQLPLLRQALTLGQEEAFWTTSPDLPWLEHLRHSLRGLMHLLRGEEQEAIYTDFEDTVMEVSDDIEIVRGLHRMEGYLQRVERFVRQNMHHLTIHKLHTNQPITSSELEELERILFDGDERGTLADLKEETGSEKPLGVLVRSIIGLAPEAASAAFASFTSRSTLRADQITFLAQIVQHLTRNGILELPALGEMPFTNVNDQGLFGVFPQEEDQDALIGIIEGINRNAVA